MALFPRLRMGLLLPLLPLIVVAGGYAQAGDEEVGSQACGACHREIYRKYSATSMPRSSGKAGKGALRENLNHAHFEDPAPGAEYRVSSAREEYLLEFSRGD